MNETVETTTGTELVPFKATPIACLTDSAKMDALLRAAKQAVAEFLKAPPDPATPKGAEEIKSFVFQTLVKTRTRLVSAAKDLTEDWRLKTDAVNAERRRAVKQLEDLEAKAIEPLAKWQDAEEDRKASIRRRISELTYGALLFTDDVPVSDLLAEKARLEAIEVDESFAEFAGEAALAKDRSLTALNKAIAAAREREAAEAKAAAELEAMAKERAAAALEQRDRLAFAIARADAEAEDAARIAAAERAAAAAAAAEARRVEQERRAAEATQRAAQEAVEAERRRVKAAADAEARKAEQRAANAKRRAKMRREIAAAIQPFLTSDDPAGQLAEALMDGKIVHMEANF
jgi:hypothetical protein